MSFLSVPISLQTFFGSSRKIGSIDVNVVINENTSDELEITQQPVQEGAMIADHAFKKPTVFSMNIYFRDNLTTSFKDIYQELLDLQESRVPFDITTPKRIYENMLLKSLGMTTDKNTENTLSIQAGFQEVLIVQVSVASVPRRSQRNAGRTGKTIKAGNKSALKIIKDAIVPAGAG